MSIAFPKPDEGILARRDEIIAGLKPLVTPEALIVSEDERRAFETDALTAYRKIPLAVVLPSTTEEVSAILKFCHAHRVKVVARGAGTSLAGGAIPQEDAVVLGVAKMNRVLAVDFARRDDILAALRPLVAAEALIVTEAARRAFATDALTAYRKLPPAGAPSSTTEEVSAVL